MTIFDLILVIIILIFVASGFWQGLIKKIGALVGLLAGILAAGYYFGSIAAWLAPFVKHNENLAKVIAFILVFIAVNVLVSVVFKVVDFIFGIFSIIPFMKTINRVLGGVLGLIEGIVTLGLLLIFIGKFPFAGFIDPLLTESNVANELSKVGNLLMPLLPEAVEQVKGLLPRIINNQ